MILQIAESLLLKMKSVSVIIPVYNSSRFLRKCIESVLGQTYKNLEILLINDGSTDNSLDIIQEYESKDGRVRSCTIPNSGVSVARNTGIKLAKSEYVVFVDSDDVISPLLIEKLIACQNNDFVMCGYEVQDLRQERQLSFHCPEFEGSITNFCNSMIDYLIPPYLLGPCFKLFKKSLVDRYHVSFPLEISFGEDAEFVLSYLEHVKTVKCLSFIGYTYRQYSSSTLSKRFRKDKMDIYNRINTHILALMKQNAAEGCIEAVHNMYIQNYVEFSKELFSAPISYIEKKNLFFTAGTSNSVLNHEKKAGRLSTAQRILLVSLRYRILLPAYLIFKSYSKYFYGLK